MRHGRRAMRMDSLRANLRDIAFDAHSIWHDGAVAHCAVADPP
jgi:hypothetical protein